MIHLTRLNGNPLVVNSDLIKYAESSPDTMLTLINGEKIVVLESCDDVVRCTIAYRGRVFAEAAGHLQALAWTPLSELTRSAPEPTTPCFPASADPKD
jgi:flagellar protein FlbD